MVSLTYLRGLDVADYKIGVIPIMERAQIKKRPN